MIGELLTNGQQMEIKIHDAKGAIMRYNLDIMKIMNDMSDNPVTEAWQMRQIAEIDVRIARRKAQIARFEAQIAEIERDLVEAVELKMSCAAKKLGLDDIFGGGVPRFRVVNLEDLVSDGGIADLLNSLRYSRRRPDAGNDVDDATSGLIVDVESAFDDMRQR